MRKCELIKRARINYRRLEAASSLAHDTNSDMRKWSWVIISTHDMASQYRHYPRKNFTTDDGCRDRWGVNGGVFLHKIGKKEHSGVFITDEEQRSAHIDGKAFKVLEFTPQRYMTDKNKITIPFGKRLWFFIYLFMLGTERGILWTERISDTWMERERGMGAALDHGDGQLKKERWTQGKKKNNHSGATSHFGCWLSQEDNGISNKL